MMPAVLRIAAALLVLGGLGPARVLAQSPAPFAYAGNESDSTLSGYRVDAATGVLTTLPGSPYATIMNPNTLAVAGQGRFLYAANLSAGQIAGYAIDRSTGALVALPGSPFSARDASGGSYLGRLQADRSGRFIFALNPSNARLVVFAVNADSGALTLVPGSPFQTGAQPLTVAVDPAGKYVYTVNAFGNTISAWSLDPASGALRPLPGSPFPLAAIPGWTPTGLELGPGGRFAYLFMRGGPGSVMLSFAVNRETGLLSPVGKPIPASPGATRLVFDPLGTFAYTVDRGFTGLVGYQVDAASGNLTPALESPYPSDPAGYPTAIDFDASGRFLYLTSGVGRLVMYAIDRDTGALQFNGVYPTGQNSTSVAIAGGAAAPLRPAPLPVPQAGAPQTDPNVPGPASALNLPLRWAVPAGSSVPYAWFNGGLRAESGQHARYLGFNDEGSWFEHADDHQVYVWNLQTLALTRRYARVADLPPGLLAGLKNAPPAPHEASLAGAQPALAARELPPARRGGEEPDPNFPAALAYNGQTGLPVTWTAGGGGIPQPELHFDQYSNNSPGQYLGFNERGSWIIGQDGKIYIWHLRTFSLLLGANRVQDLPREVLQSLRNRSGSVGNLLGENDTPAAPPPPKPAPAPSRLDPSLFTGAGMASSSAGTTSAPAITGRHAAISQGVLSFVRADGSKASYKVARPRMLTTTPGLAAGADGLSGGWIALEDNGKGILFTVQGDGSVGGQEMPGALLQMLLHDPQSSH